MDRIFVAGFHGKNLVCSKFVFLMPNPLIQSDLKTIRKEKFVVFKRHLMDHPSRVAGLGRTDFLDDDIHQQLSDRNPKYNNGAMAEW